MDAVLRYMKDNKLPMTRETYLRLAYLGDVPETLGGEEEAALPEIFQSGYRSDDEE
jgi:hypothetical protein